MSKQATAMRADYETGLEGEAAASQPAIAPGKRTITQQHRGAGVHTIAPRINAIRDRQLPSLRAALEAKQMDEARTAARLIRYVLRQIDEQLESARLTATETAAAKLEELTAQRDALRAEAEPVLAMVREDDAPAAPVQMFASGGDVSAETHAHAQAGIAGAGGAIPHLDAIQASFGAHDISGVRAHVGGAAASASAAIGAEAYATGNDVAFSAQPSLFVAAHEAAHVVQQRAGVSLYGGVGAAGDSYEQHADAVAEKVVRGESAEGLLGEHVSGTTSHGVQRSWIDDKLLDRMALVSKLKDLDIHDLKTYVTSSIVLAVSSYVSAVEKAELRDAMKKPDLDFWSVILEVFFGSLPTLAGLGNATALARAFGIDASIVVEVADSAIDAGVVGGVMDAGKEVAKDWLAKAPSMTDFYDSMKDAANGWAQSIILETLAIHDRVTLVQLALAYDYGEHHGVSHYYPIVKRTIDGYRKDVVPLGARVTDEVVHGGDYETIEDTEIAIIEHGRARRPAVVQKRRYDNHLGDKFSDDYYRFHHWVTNEVATLAEGRQREKFGTERTIQAIDLRKPDRNGQDVPASEIDDSLAQWMAYGDDYNLWPEW